MVCQISCIGGNLSERSSGKTSANSVITGVALGGIGLLGSLLTSGGIGLLGSLLTSLIVRITKEAPFSTS